MKTKIFRFATLFMILNTSIFIQNSFSQWEQVSTGMANNQSVYSFTAIGNNIFAGTNGGYVYYSTNNGTYWFYRPIIGEINVYSLATSGNNIFAGGAFSVYLSTNSGNNWTQTALNNQSVYSLAVSGGNVFAGTGTSGVYFSTNNGTSWTQTALNNQAVFSIAISGNNIFTGTNGTGVYLSTNNGTSWTQTALNNKSVRSLAISGNNIFAGCYYDQGVYLSTNNGTSWTQTALNNQTVFSIAISSNNLFAGTGASGIYFSTNNGTNWVQKNQGFSNIPTINTLFIANDYIFAGTSSNSAWRRSLTEIISGIKNINSEVPSAFSLEQNYPNPFNPTTNIKFQIVKSGIVKLTVFDMLGKEIATLVNENLQPGTYETSFDASQLRSGIYFYRLQADSYTETKRMIFIK